MNNYVRLLFLCVKSDLGALKKPRPHHVKFNIISPQPLLSRFQKLSVATAVSTSTPQHPSSAFTGKHKVFFFIIITGNSFFKCGSLGKACLMHFELITIFSLMMHKVVLSVEKWKPSYTTHPNSTLFFPLGQTRDFKLHPNLMCERELQRQHRNKLLQVHREALKEIHPATPRTGGKTRWWLAQNRSSFHIWL